MFSNVIMISMVKLMDKYEFNKISSTIRELLWNSGMCRTGCVRELLILFRTIFPVTDKNAMLKKPKNWRFIGENKKIFQ